MEQDCWLFSSFRLVISCYLHDDFVAALIIEVIIGCAFHIVVIYNRLVVQYNSISIPSVDLSSYFKQSRANYDDAVVQNTLLFTSLSISIMVSVIAL